MLMSQRTARPEMFGDLRSAPECAALPWTRTYLGQVQPRSGFPDFRQIWHPRRVAVQSRLATCDASSQSGLRCPTYRLAPQVTIFNAELRRLKPRNPLDWSSTSPCNGPSLGRAVRSGSRGPGRSCLAGYLEHTEAGQPGRAVPLPRYATYSARTSHHLGIAKSLRCFAEPSIGAVLSRTSARARYRHNCDRRFRRP